MSDSWILSLPCSRAEAEQFSGEHPVLAPVEPAPVVVASEIDEDEDRWRIDLYFEEKPDRATERRIAAALNIAAASAPRAALVPPQDWVTLSQAGFGSVRAGRFHVHSGNDAPDPSPGIVNFRIEASQAFGTGHHDTTAGCLAALDRLHRQGLRFANIADIGTGTGLLAFAGLALWPRAVATASDIDPVSVAVTRDNAVMNAVPLGDGPGRLALTVADGTRAPMIALGAPYDLVIANILAGPLISLAPALAAIAAPGTRLVLAGLITRQRPAVVAAYRRAGFRLDDAGGGAEWPVLVMTLRHRPGHVRPLRADGRGGLPPGDFGSW